MAHGVVLLGHIEFKNLLRPTPIYSHQIIIVVILNGPSNYLILLSI